VAERKAQVRDAPKTRPPSARRPSRQRGGAHVGRARAGQREASLNLIGAIIIQLTGGATESA
jgi:hypothetical protein